jgi:hypothetical protein
MPHRIFNGNGLRMRAVSLVRNNELNIGPGRCGFLSADAIDKIAAESCVFRGRCNRLATAGLFFKLMAIGDS